MTLNAEKVKFHIEIVMAGFIFRGMSLGPKVIMRVYSATAVRGISQCV